VDSGFARYLTVLRTPQVPPLIASSVLARVPLAVTALALLLFMRERTGSFATAGLIAGAYALAAGVFAPVGGRLVDRHGQTRVIVPFVFLHGAAVSSLVLLGLAGAPSGVLGIVAALSGASLPPISASTRPLWRDLLGDDLVTTGWAIDSILIEFVFILGPLATAAVVALFSPAAALVMGGAMVVTGGLWFASLPASREWRPTERHSGAWGALSSPGMRTIAAASLPIGVCFGMAEVVLPAFGTSHGSAGLGGVLIAAQGVGSAVAGFWYGAGASRLGGVPRAYLILLALLPFCFAVLAIPTVVWLMFVAAFVSGTIIAPITIAENLVAQQIAPAGTVTEAFTWLIMSAVVGIAIGNAGAGALVDSAGRDVAVLISCGIGALAALIAYARRRTLFATQPAEGEPARTAPTSTPSSQRAAG
jgi:MFS family permease